MVGWGRIFGRFSLYSYLENLSPTKPLLTSPLIRISKIQFRLQKYNIFANYAKKCKKNLHICKKSTNFACNNVYTYDLVMLTL